MVMLIRINKLLPFPIVCSLGVDLALKLHYSLVLIDHNFFPKGLQYNPENGQI